MRRGGRGELGGGGWGGGLSINLYRGYEADDDFQVQSLI